MKNNSVKNNSVDYTSLYTEEEWTEQHTYVYCYTVFWKEKFNLSSAMWYQKPFASKKNAKTFAKKKKDKTIKLKPYILRTTVYRGYFRTDVKVEEAYRDHDVVVIKV